MTLPNSGASGAGNLPLEPRCRVCRDDVVREKVNSMLACGSSYAQIARAVAGIQQDAVVTVNSVRVHANRHFPVQHSAKAVYREIVERRAEQNRVDFAKGLSIVITPIAYFEALMAKAFATLVDDDTQVGVETGLRAAERLQAITGDHDPGMEILQIRAQVSKIQNAVKSSVPRETLEEIYRRLEEEEEGQSEAAMGPMHGRGDDEDDDEDDDEAFGPVDDGDDDDL